MHCDLVCTVWNNPLEMHLFVEIAFKIFCISCTRYQHCLLVSFQEVKGKPSFLKLNFKIFCEMISKTKHPATPFKIIFFSLKKWTE